MPLQDFHIPVWPADAAPEGATPADAVVPSSLATRVR